jgi:hypothetical protein
MNFVSATPDIVVIYGLVCKSIFCVRLREAAWGLREARKFHFSCLSHVIPESRPFLVDFLSVSADHIVSAPRVPTGVNRNPWPQERYRWFRTERRYRRRVGAVCVVAPEYSVLSPKSGRWCTKARDSVRTI